MPEALSLDVLHLYEIQPTNYMQKKSNKYEYEAQISPRNLSVSQKGWICQSWDPCHSGSGIPLHLSIGFFHQVLSR
jgi:hypothetical protein